MKARRFDFYPDDWLAGTMMLEMDERGVYITAIAAMYSHGGSIKKTELRRLCPMHGNSFNSCVKKLVDIGKLIRKGDDFTQKRVENELKKSRKRIGNAAKNGRIGGVQSNKNNKLAREVLQQNGSDPLHLPSPSPSPSPKKEKRERERAHQTQKNLLLLSDGEGSLSLSKEFKLLEEWVVEARNQRAESDLPDVNLKAEAAKYLLAKRPKSREDWLRWALNARALPDAARIDGESGGEGHVTTKGPPGPAPPLTPEQQKLLEQLGAEEGRR